MMKKRSLLERIVLTLISCLFTVGMYYLLSDYFGLDLKSFPEMLLVIYIALAMVLFPAVAPTDYREGLLITQKVLFPVYYLISPILFFYQHFTGKR